MLAYGHDKSHDYLSYLLHLLLLSCASQSMCWTAHQLGGCQYYYFAKPSDLWSGTGPHLGRSVLQFTWYNSCLVWFAISTFLDNQLELKFWPWLWQTLPLQNSVLQNGGIGHYILMYSLSEITVCTGGWMDTVIPNPLKGPAGSPMYCTRIRGCKWSLFLWDIIAFIDPQWDGKCFEKWGIVFF